MGRYRRFVSELEVGTVNVWEAPGYRIEMSPFGGVKNSGLGYKEGVVEAMKSFTNVRTYSLPWPCGGQGGAMTGEDLPPSEGDVNVRRRAPRGAAR